MRLLCLPACLFLFTKRVLCCAAAAPVVAVPMGGAGGVEETKDEPVATSLIRAASDRIEEVSDDVPVPLADTWDKHHPMQYLEGCPITSQLHARFAFQKLYSLLTPMISGGSIAMA